MTSEKSGREVRIIRDGDVIAVVASDADAWLWLHRKQPQSVEWALRYGGYRIEVVPEDASDDSGGAS